jgi:predicted nucleic acid-binding protein
MTAKVFFDTNLLIYLYSSDEIAKQDKVLEYVETHENRWISTQVSSELCHVLRRKFKLEYAQIENVLTEIRTSFQITTVTVDTIERALKIATHYHYSYYDSLIIAAALEISCDFLFSEDMQHGQLISKHVKIFNPLS